MGARGGQGCGAEGKSIAWVGGKVSGWGGFAPRSGLWDALMYISSADIATNALSGLSVRMPIFRQLPC